MAKVDRIGYTSDLCFIPDGGVLYVDTSAIQWIDVDDGMVRDFETLEKRVGVVYKYLQRRTGLVLSTEGVLEELQHEIDFHRERKDFLNQNKGRRIEKYNGVSMRSLALSQESPWTSVEKRLEKKIRRIKRYLESQMKKHPNERPALNYQEVNQFMTQCPMGSGDNSYLSEVDMDLVRAALLEGDGAGIFSADNLLGDAYIRGVREFGFKSCFISRANKYRTWEIE